MTLIKNKSMHKFAIRLTSHKKATYIKLFSFTSSFQMINESHASYNNTRKGHYKLYDLIK